MSPQKKYLISALIITIVFVSLSGIFLYNEYSQKQYDKDITHRFNRQNKKSAQQQTAIRKSLKWVGCGITKKAFISELSNAFFKETSIKINIAGGGATKGIRDTASLKSDLGGSCRHILTIKQEENARFIPIAWDALVIIVHPDNPINNISLQQIRNLLKGKHKNWQELGAFDKKLKLVIRHQGAGGKVSGVGRMIRELVFANPDEDFADDAIQVASSGPLEKLVEKDISAVGTTGISSAKKRKVKILNLNNIQPDYKNICTGKYPLFRPLYLIIPRDMSQVDEGIKKFVRFALSDKGQNVIKQCGTVNLTDGANLWKPFRENMCKAGIKMGHY